MLSTNELDEIVFQVILSRMQNKKQFVNPITMKTMTRLVDQVITILEKEPVMLQLDANITIVGDLHGNIDDLLRIFEKLRYPPAMKYLFLGDYIDRGVFGTEVLTLLFALKCKYPNNIYLLRGNHESISLSRVYGFYKEVTAKYNSDLYYYICEAFEELPLCAQIGERIFCVHGGISPCLRNTADLLKMQKPQEDLSIPNNLFTDMVWSDPEESVKGWMANNRGCGYLFGAEPLSKFLDNNNLDILVRSHEVCNDGVSWPYSSDEQNVDRCLTVFSTSNYCGRGNTAAVLYVNSDLLVNVEFLQPLSETEMKKRKVLLPFWLYDFISRKEAEKATEKVIKNNSKSTYSSQHQLIKQKKLDLQIRQISGENCVENL